MSASKFFPIWQSKNQLHFSGSMLKTLTLANQHKFSSSNSLVFNFVPSIDLANMGGVVHGGAIATLIDCSTSFTVSAFDRTIRDTASIEITCQYLNPLKIGEDYVVVCEIPKIGKSISFASCRILNREEKLCASGNHVVKMLEFPFVSYI